MRWVLAVLIATVVSANAQTPALQSPASVVAGSAFAVITKGSGKGTLLLVGPGGALRRELALGDSVEFAASEVYSAGHYLLVLTSGSASVTGALDVLPAPRAVSLGFLARPSRLPVGVRGGVSGTAYIFDAYGNLILTPMQASFELSAPSGATSTRTSASRNGVAWTTMDSAPKQGRARFQVQVGGVVSTRVIDQVPGDPCGLTMSAHPANGRVALETAPVHDCAGNAIPDGTVVTFTESYRGQQSTVDAPVKKGSARAEMPSVPGARFSVASGVVAGNEIRWDGGR